MSILKETAHAVKDIKRLVKQVGDLVKQEQPLEEHQNRFSVRSHLAEDNDTIGSAEEIEAQPSRQGRVVSEEPMPIVFVQKEGRWIPTLFRQVSGQMGRLVNRKNNINMRVDRSTLEPLSAKQRQSKAIQNLKERYPKASFFIYKQQ